MADARYNPAPKSSTSSSPAQSTIGTTAGQAIAANSARDVLMIQNTGTTILKFSLGATSPTATAYHFALAPGSTANDGQGGTCISDMWTGAVQVISSAAGGTYVISELT